MAKVAPTVVASRTLRMIQGEVEAIGSGKIVRVGRDPIIVGRNPSCHIVLADAKVSALHLEVSATEHGLRVRDLQSRNATWLGDVRITDAHVTEPTTISVGDQDLEIRPDREERIDLGKKTSEGRMYGQSTAMRAVFERIRRVGGSDLGVLIQGETGVGKELVAEAIHQASPRKRRPFVTVDCAAIAPTLAESLLLGHERGAFTGAVARKLSPFLEAHGGTLFLDELGELPLEVQPKLLRVLAESRVQAVGANVERPFDVRVIAATRRDLVQAVNRGAFRSDLYFRVAQVTLWVPPLRERLGDIPGLVRAILAQVGGEKAARRVSNAQLTALMEHDWPGNVRELKNAVVAALALAEKNEKLDVTAQLVPGAELGGSASAGDAGSIQNYHAARERALERFERQYFGKLMELVGDNVSEMARSSGLTRVHVRRHLQERGLLSRRRRS